MDLVASKAAAEEARFDVARRLSEVGNSRISVRECIEGLSFGGLAPQLACKLIFSFAGLMTSEDRCSVAGARVSEARPRTPA